MVKATPKSAKTNSTNATPTHAQVTKMMSELQQERKKLAAQKRKGAE